MNETMGTCCVPAPVSEQLVSIVKETNQELFGLEAKLEVLLRLVGGNDGNCCEKKETNCLLDDVKTARATADRLNKMTLALMDMIGA